MYIFFHLLLLLFCFVRTLETILFNNIINRINSLLNAFLCHCVLCLNEFVYVSWKWIVCSCERARKKRTKFEISSVIYRTDLGIEFFFSFFSLNVFFRVV